MPTEGWRGAAGDGCKVGLLHATCASVYIWLQLMGAKLAPAQSKIWGGDDLEVFSTIKDPFGLETKSCSKSSRPTVLNVEAGVGVKRFQT